MLIYLAAAVLGAVLGAIACRLVGARPDAELVARALRAETALGIAHQNLELARHDARALHDQLGSARENAAGQTAALGEARAQLEREREAMRATSTHLRDSFQTLAGEALKGANEQFFALAQGGLRALVEKADGSLEQREKAVSDLVSPVRDALTKLGEEQRALAQVRTRETATFSAELQGLRFQHDQLSTETARLVNALRAPQVRGRWGEIQLRRTAELAGMSEHCDFSEQESVQSEDGLRRPDMVVHLPRGREVIVDSKVPFNHFLEAVEALTDVGREEALKRHAQLVRSHVEKLSEKRYWAQFRGADFVVMFLPNDSFLAAAAERDPELIEWASEAKVVLATPTTFIALLRAIAVGWREERLAENAERIAALGRDLYDRLCKLSEHVGEIGEGLKRTVKAYNRSIGSLETRVLVQARRFKELDAASEREIEELSPVDEVPRELNS